jgi:hypothetical protein
MHTKVPTKRLAKLAAKIHARLTVGSPLPGAVEVPHESWQHALRKLRLWQLATQRHWSAARAALQEDLHRSFCRLSAEISQLTSRLPLFHAPAVIASAHEIYRDLAALYDEFDEVTWSQRKQKLAVTTPPITLEARYLGPFLIELDLRDLCGHPSYTVTATDPQPAAPNSDVTHPHVQSRHLCEGEGTSAIRAAARSGRLLDFFLIIRNLLETYNSSSPFVSLDDWESSRCSECDYTMLRDDECSCEQCDTQICSECVRSCTDCARSLCGSCSQDCSRCHSDLCRSCARECRDCSESFCSSCLNDEERCAVCHEEFEREEEVERCAADAAF